MNNDKTCLPAGFSQILNVISPVTSAYEMNKGRLLTSCTCQPPPDFSLIALRPVDASPQPSGGALPSDGEFYQLSPHRRLSVHRLRRFWSWAALGGV